VGRAKFERGAARAEAFEAAGGQNMSDKTIVFDDGASYERMMGVWSRGVGADFLDWLAPAKAWRWADVGCGNGAFSQLVFDRCAPESLDGVDPSEGQLAFARRRLEGRPARFARGDAAALPWPDDAFDAAVMALVIFFVPEPAKGVAEMARVAKPGAVVAAYAWDMTGAGFPLAALHEELEARGVHVPTPPSAAASRIDALRELWNGAALTRVETR
jgi:ubiquinone/menaquinone biosynthesis C-methylase UbiE